MDLLISTVYNFLARQDLHLPCIDVSSQTPILLRKANFLYQSDYRNMCLGSDDYLSLGIKLVYQLILLG